MVETNALFGRDSIRPVMAGELPEDVQALVLRHVLNQETVLKAAVRKDKGLAFNAFLNEPLVNISVNDVERLFDQMLKNTREYLPG